MPHDRQTTPASLLGEIQAEEDRVWEETQTQQADALAKERESQARVAKDARALIRSALSTSAPHGHSNDWKVDAIADFIQNRAHTKDGQRAVLRNLITQSRRHTKGGHWNEIDRVYLTLRGGQVR